MATHDYVIANGTGAAVRSDLNNALAAIVSNNSGSSEPGTTYAYQWWADTNANVLKIRNSSNDGWITLRELDGTMLIEDGSVSTPGLAFADDVNTGIFSPAADTIGFATNGAERLRISNSGVIVNESSNSTDFRVESNGNTHMLFVDGGNDRVGIGTDTPSHNLDILSTSSGTTVSARVASTATSGVNSANLIINNGGTGNGTLRFDYEGDTNRASIGVSQSTQDLEFGTAGSERARIDSSGRLLVGTSSVVVDTARSMLQVASGHGEGPNFVFAVDSSDITSGEALGSLSFYGNDGGSYQEGARIAALADGTHANNDKPTRLEFSTTADGASSPSIRMTIDSEGRIQLGDHSGTNVTHTSTAQVNIAKLDDIATSFSKAACYLHLGNAESTANGLYPIGFGFSTDERTHLPAYIAYFTEDSGGAEHGPLIFATRDVTTDTAPSERMRVTSGGSVLIGQGNESFGTRGHIFKENGQAFHICDDDTPLLVNRQDDDGELVRFAQNDATEGNITVSGSTVSYNGGHLSRWSQLAGGAERAEILRGSVLSNLDEMCEWVHAAQDAVEAQDAVFYTEEDELPEGYAVGDLKTPAVEASPAVDAYTENNEQLNRMKVSDVEGDVNVAGVFQAWDDDDDTYTNDFYCAMTGDFVIRIAQGTTVARGDLLMSAGDGTAKPQDDDIVRSKTIAKVTSTTVSTTYSDGSYCVPCVLMAC